ncbi:hypothetical protein TL18_07170 [Methanobrevibacter sp. YE315]|uniref:hypothetical protein n=1 Tax=Methanobrevibacter sp. YE315 TaxID=1609968 RepID=UPI000764EBE1|nr:hypothetical protein [Methanobrevibacter sp. YE315]AMD17818.1 hypothetical protein TL18_07170 [Methanobrevibacter sp. YE315]
MNGITILIWITIALIGMIAIILVKLHYKDDELETSENPIISSTKGLSGIISSRKEKSNNILSRNSSQHSANKSLYGNRTSIPKDDAYIVPEANNEQFKRFEYESENQVLINYGNEVKKFQEPIKQSQMDIMTQNKEDKTELKDLFTIDELIKESKRKDNEREKESQKITEDDDLTEIKESIKQKQENKIDEPLIEEIIDENDTIEELLNETPEEISEIISEEPSSEIIEETPEIETPITTQKDIEEAITSASQESEEEIESISEETNITDVLLDAEDDEIDIPNEEIKEPTLKSPSKIGESKDNSFGAPIEDSTLYNEEEKDMDLDYRKDLDKLANKIKGSKIFKEVKEKLVFEQEETPETEGFGEVEESYIRNVNEFDEFEPIINETHIDYDDTFDDIPSFDDEQRLREENTRKVFNMAKTPAPEPELAEEKIGAIKNKPSKDNIKINLNNNEVVLKRGDEIIFNHLGETYSSQVYAINGDDISVRYRRKNITIKPEDVKKIY